MQEKSKTQQIKTAKDFTFLQSLQFSVLNRNTVKYKLQEGNGQILKDINFPFDIYFNYIKYSYSGVLVERSQSIRTSKQNDQSKPSESQRSLKMDLIRLKPALLEMKVHEKVWLNICDQELPPTLLKLLNQQPQNIIETDAQWQNKDININTGLHYELYLQKIQYRNINDFQAKSKVIEQSREKAKELFSKGKFSEAILIYKYISNITQNFSKAKLKDTEIDFLLEHNLKSRLNYLVCFFKLQDFEQTQDQFKGFFQSAMKILKQNKYNESKVIYYYAKWLFKEKYIQDALSEAKKAYEMQPNNTSTLELLREIRFALQIRGKIKVEVN